MIVPSAVFTELQHRKTPEKVKAWTSTPPVWIEIRQANLAAFTPQKKIGPGEQEAFALALELQATAVLLDDRAAMVEAERHHIVTIPTFSILEQAAARDLIVLPNAVDAMRRTSFRLPSELEIDAMLKRDRQRKQTV